jgi:hypothetical protein
MTRTAFSAFLVLAAAAAFAAPDPTGKWVGKLIKGPDVQSNTTSTFGRTQLNVFHEDFSSARYTLDLKSDHTFIRLLHRGKATSSTTGVWSVRGLGVTMTTREIAGTKIKAQDSLFVLSASGKTLTYRQANGVTLQYVRSK